MRQLRLHWLVSLVSLVVWFPRMFCARQVMDRLSWEDDVTAHGKEFGKEWALPNVFAGASSLVYYDCNLESRVSSSRLLNTTSRLLCQSTVELSLRE